MKLLDRLKPHFITIAVVYGLALAWAMSPLDWLDGFILFLFGAVAGDWNRQLNLGVDISEGPMLPWDDMHVGERLTYFLPALAIIIFGLIFLAMAIQSSQVTINWRAIGASLFVIALGILEAYSKWLHRYRSVDDR